MYATVWGLRQRMINKFLTRSNFVTRSRFVVDHARYFCMTIF